VTPQEPSRRIEEQLRMRGRTVSLIVVGLGAFALVAALCVRLILAPDLVKLPLDQAALPEASASDLTMFDFESMDEVSGLDAVVLQEVAGEPDADGAGDDLAVWNFGSTIQTADDVLLDESSYRVCIDRRTAVSDTDCPSAFVDGKPDATIDGLTLTFPFGTEKRDYELFNLTAAQSFTATFSGVEEIDGLEVYKFVQDIPETVVEEKEVPGAMAGQPGDGSVDAEFVYTNTRTLWVEPTSGVIVTAAVKPLIVIRGPEGKTGVTWLSASFAATDKTLADGLERARDTRSQITLIEKTVPLSLAGLGVLLLLVGGVLVGRRRGGDDSPRHQDDGTERPLQDAQVY
jgi:hypothetical protein